MSSGNPNSALWAPILGFPGPHTNRIGPPNQNTPDSASLVPPLGFLADPLYRLRAKKTRPNGQFFVGLAGNRTARDEYAG